jgi:hypothetical protein
LGQENLENARAFVPYKSLVFCFIDEIFSIHAKYNPITINVLERIAERLGVDSRFEAYRVSDLLTKYQDVRPKS